MSFQVGDEVVCVDAAFHKEWQVPGVKYSAWDGSLTAGQHYIIRSIETAWPTTTQPGPHLHLEGVRKIGKHAPFASGRFRKVKKDEIELFRQMCVSPKPLVPLPETPKADAPIVLDWKRFARFLGGKD